MDSIYIHMIDTTDMEMEAKTEKAMETIIPMATETI